MGSVVETCAQLCACDNSLLPNNFNCEAFPIDTTVLPSQQRMASPASPAISSSSSFSFVESQGDPLTRSRASTASSISSGLTFDASDLDIVSDLGTSSPRTNSEASFIVGRSAAEEEDDGDFVLIMPGSGLLLRSRSQSIASNHSAALSTEHIPRSLQGEVERVTRWFEGHSDIERRELPQAQVTEGVAGVPEDEEIEVPERDPLGNLSHQGDDEDSDEEEIVFTGDQLASLSIGNYENDHPRAATATPTARPLSLPPVTSTSIPPQQTVVEEVASTPTRQSFVVTPTPRKESKRQRKRRRAAETAARAGGNQVSEVAVLTKNQRRKARRKKQLEKQDRKGKATEVKKKAVSVARTLPAGYDSDDEDLQSEYTSASGDLTSEMYDEAVEFVTAYIKEPPKQPPKGIRLHFLQSLIIELGLLSLGAVVVLPTSCTSAKAFLKAKAHLNVGEYAKSRTIQTTRLITDPSTNIVKEIKVEVGAGPEVLHKLLYPSKAALAKSLRTKKKKVSRDWIKDRGLDVFMVTTCF